MTYPKPPVGQQAETGHVAYLKDGSAHCKCGWPTDGVARRWHQVDIHIKQATCNHEWYQPPPPQSYCSSCFTNKPVASPVTLSGETDLQRAQRISELTDAEIVLKWGELNADDGDIRVMAMLHELLLHRKAAVTLSEGQDTQEKK